MTIPRKGPQKGRGAVSNPKRRFEKDQTEAFDDGWGTIEEELPPLQTTVRADPARSIISRNDSPDIGFEQSINPYRGCEHGCVYCLHGDTRILMGDGSTRALKDLRAGDEVYGTARDGWYRRYTKTRVLAHWRVVKPAYRITLEDGTELVAGPDHRFLTERGWKFVRGAGHGKNCRPHLTISNKLMGIGSFEDGPEKGATYRNGYLCGLIRGDGLLKEFHYQRVGRTHGNQYQFRLALCDREALDRAKDYLYTSGIVVRDFLFSRAVAGRREMRAIRTHAQQQVADIREVIAWPEVPTCEWNAGFLAGIFDAEGSYSGGVLRISNTDAEIIAWLGRCLESFGFEFVIEHTKLHHAKPVDVVRVVGGLREHLRFFHTTDPAIMRKRDIAGQAVKSNAKLRVVSIESLGRAMALYDMTTGTEDFIANGVVSHNCYARPSHAYFNLSPGLDFETRLFYKENAGGLLEKELRKPGYKVSPIMLGANTDPYQPVERRLRVTRDILDVLNRYHHPVSIVTKGSLIERDVELLAEMAQRRLAGVMISVTSLRDDIKRTLEPRTASPRTRLKMIRLLSDAGVPVGVLVAPIIPVITDPEMESILEACAEAGAKVASYVLLRLPHEVKELFDEWLKVHEPLKAKHVMSLMHQMSGGKAYDSTWGVRQRGTGQFAELLAQRFRVATKRLKLDQWDWFKQDCSQFKPPPAAGDQISLL